MESWTTTQARNKLSNLLSDTQFNNTPFTIRYHSRPGVVAAPPKWRKRAAEAIVADAPTDEHQPEVLRAPVNSYVELRAKLGDFVQEAMEGHVQYELPLGRYPAAVLVSLEWYERGKELIGAPDAPRRQRRGGGQKT
ncbi:hypothetical protein [Streptomyces noursei]